MDGAVKRADHLDGDVERFLKHRKNLRPIFADDVGVIPARFVQIEVALGGIDVAIKRPKGAESVRAIEDLLGELIGHHDFGPMDHRGHHEGEFMFADA